MAPNKSYLVARSGTRQDGAVLRELRLDRLLTLEEAAGKVGCATRSLEYLEKERRGASELMIRKIAKAYGVKPDKIRKQDEAA